MQRSAGSSLLIFALLIGSCATPAKKAKPVPVIGLEKFQKGWIEAAGIGAPRPGLTDPKERKKSSLENAIRMAQRELETIVMGMELENGSRLNALAAQDNPLLLRLEKILKKSKILKKDWTRDQGCAVRIGIEKIRIEKKLNIKLR